MKVKGVLCFETQGDDGGVVLQREQNINSKAAKICSIDNGRALLFHRFQTQDSSEQEINNYFES